MGILKKRLIKVPLGIVAIESANIEDAEEVINVRKKIDDEIDFFFREQDEPDFGLEDEENFIEDKRLSRRELFIKATLGGKIIGTLDLNVTPIKSGVYIGDFGVAVIKECYNMGIATAMMNLMFEWCEEKGIKKVTLEVDNENKNAIGLYKKLGFREEKIVKKNMKLADGSCRDSLVMNKILD